MFELFTFMQPRLQQHKVTRSFWSSIQGSNGLYKSTPRNYAMTIKASAWSGAQVQQYVDSNRGPHDWESGVLSTWPRHAHLK